MVYEYTPDSENPMWDDGSGGQDNPRVLRDRQTGEALQYNGSYWIAYNTGSGSSLISATDLADKTTWTGEGTVGSTASGDYPGDFLDMSGLDDTTPYWLFTNDTTDLYVTKSSDMVSWTTLTNVTSGALASPEDLSIQQRPDGSWFAIYEEDGQTAGVAVNAATTTNTTPEGGWTDHGAAFRYDEGYSFLANPCLRRVDIGGVTHYEAIYESLSGTDNNPTPPFVARGAWVEDSNILTPSAWTFAGSVYTPASGWEGDISVPNSIVTVGGTNYLFYTGNSGSNKALGLATGEQVVDSIRNFPEMATPIDSGAARTKDFGGTLAMTDDAITTGTGTGVVDSFEDAGLTEYSAASGTVGDWNVNTTAPVNDGAYSLKPTTTGYTIYSNSGLARYPDGGEVYATDIYYGSGSVNFYLHYFTQASSDDGYTALVGGPSGVAELRLYRKENDTFTLLTSTALTAPTGEWVTAEIQPASPGTHVVTIYDSANTQLAQVSYDTSGDAVQYTDGGIGFEVGGGTNAAFDNARIIDNPIYEGSTVDSFEDADLSEYQADTRALSDWNVDTTAPVSDGSYSLKSTFGDAVISSSSGLAAYPDGGDTYSVDVYWEDGNPNFYLYYFTQASSDDSYTALLGGQNGVAELRLYRKDAGSFTLLQSATMTAPIGEWVTAEIQPASPGTHVVTAYDAAGTQLAQVSYDTSGDATQYNDGGIGFQIGSSTAGAIDYGRLL